MNIMKTAHTKCG